MFAVGAILLLVGVLALAGGGLQRYRAGRIAKAPFFRTGQVSQAAGHPRRAVSTQGAMQAPQLVVSPVTRTDCLYYEYSVLASWKAGDSSRSKMVDQGRVAAPFTVDDGSGPVWVDATRGGDIELETTFRKSQGRGIVNIATGGPIKFGEHGFSVLPGQKIDGVRIPDDAKYEVTERCMLPAQRFYVNGKLDEQNRITSPAWASLMISKKGREELLAGTATFAKRLLIGGGVVSAAGAVLLVVAQITGSA